MRTFTGQLKLYCLSAIVVLSLNSYSQSTGRVLINEYLNWPANNCNTNSEFVELMNFGPGPVDISCYIVTNGIYSITIPPNTVLQPGEFFLLGGEDIIAKPCANTDSAVHVNLNWNTCGCTNIPITGADGFLADGSVANEKLVLFDRNMNVVDAVARELPLIPSNGITTAGSAGGCMSRTFDLDTMNIRYEILGMSAGRANSFARVMDGDCQWVKDPEQTGGATNNKNLNSDITYSFVLTNAMDCDSVSHGTVSIYVKHNDYGKIFPMGYTLVLDSNKNGTFDFDDYYRVGRDSTPTEIRIDSLVIGRYRVTVGSADGCYLKTFEFSILPCYPTLPVKLIYFRHSGVINNQHQLEWMLTDLEYLQSVTVEKSRTFGNFIPEQVIETPDLKGSKQFSLAVAGYPAYQYFRLKIRSKDGKEYYSPVLSSNLTTPYRVQKFWPNPAMDKLNLEITATEQKRTHYTIHNMNGAIVADGLLELKAGTNITSVPVQVLPAGIYQIQVRGVQADNLPISFRFVKH